ncbi:flagellar biosynthetic protein FliO [Pseudodesulfovibrio indicus]|uniref:Flagellar protein n=2 Tax=Pseudodesulfovibrio indicus TaxID=1716143 RepID=A0AA94TIY0_9BACT|nr:flagellar biosynthetic protein FliO [Pseudodesulfovibrio indicus]TDT86355.1 flagellar protein FliO/FliZ [Pseudodesulfovibrio indicus]
MDSTATVSTPAPMPLPAVDSGTTFLTTAGYLCLLLGVIFLAYWLLRRYGVPGALTTGKDGPRLRNRLMLGNRQSVAVVRYRDRDLLLGVTEHAITLLSESEAAPEEERPERKSFAAVLKKGSDDA